MHYCGFRGRFIAQSDVCAIVDHNNCCVQKPKRSLFIGCLTSQQQIQCVSWMDPLRQLYNYAASLRQVVDPNCFLTMGWYHGS